MESVHMMGVESNTKILGLPNSDAEVLANTITVLDDARVNAMSYGNNPVTRAILAALSAAIHLLPDVMKRAQRRNKQIRDLIDEIDLELDGQNWTDTPLTLADVREKLVAMIGREIPENPEWINRSGSLKSHPKQ